MLMNVPTVTLILLKLRAQDKNNEDPSKLAADFLLYWKQMRAGAKDKVGSASRAGAFYFLYSNLNGGYMLYLRFVHRHDAP